jgi:hypothetical protein
MENNKYKSLKLALIISVILNLSFISGFILKKYVFSPGHREDRPAQNKHICQHHHHQTGYRHLSQKSPEFKSTFHQHRKYYRKVSNDLIQIKTRLLNELKKKEIDEQTTDQLLKEINRLTSELNRKNYLHLLSLKKFLEPGDFIILLDSMNYELGLHRDMHSDMEGDHVCKDDED